MRKLTNPVESLDNVAKSERYKPHGSRISGLLSPASLAAIRQVSPR